MYECQVMMRGHQSERRILNGYGCGLGFGFGVGFGFGFGFGFGWGSQPESHDRWRKSTTNCNWTLKESLDNLKYFNWRRNNSFLHNLHNLHNFYSLLLFSLLTLSLSLSLNVPQQFFMTRHILYVYRGYFCKEFLLCKMPKIHLKVNHFIILLLPPFFFS